MKSGNLRKKMLVGAVVLLLGLVLFGAWYVNDYYHAEEGVQQYLQSTENVAVSEIGQGIFFDGPGTENALVFYPGAKVEYTAYAPLLSLMAEQGMDCFLVKMPCNLAILGKNKADGIIPEYSYENWYMSGHSLGGAMAASYASEHLAELKGVLLLAAYPTASLKAEEFSVLSVYGSEDKVLNREKLEEGRQYMPETYKEVCIEGGNHAWFGLYGEQEGDGTAAIFKEEQWQQTCNLLQKELQY